MGKFPIIYNINFLKLPHNGAICVGNGSRDRQSMSRTLCEACDKIPPETFDYYLLSFTVGLANKFD